MFLDRKLVKKIIKHYQFQDEGKLLKSFFF